MRLYSLWQIAIFRRLKVGRWPTDIGCTVGRPKRQLGFFVYNDMRAYGVEMPQTRILRARGVLSMSVRRCCA